jgi:RNA-directed DNA polymerase
LEQLARRFKDRDLLDLFQVLLETYHTDSGKGMPIGNLISQHLANFYLSVFDHWVKEDLKIKGYLRYMDDFILFGPDKMFLKSTLEQVRTFLEEKLELTLKDNVQLNRSARGIPFIGYRVFPAYIRLAPQSRKRFILKFKQYEKRWQTGEWSENELVRHMEPLIEFTRAADTGNFRKNVIQRFGVSS